MNSYGEWKNIEIEHSEHKKVLRASWKTKRRTDQEKVLKLDFRRLQRNIQDDLSDELWSFNHHKRSHVALLTISTQLASRFFVIFNKTKNLWSFFILFLSTHTDSDLMVLDNFSASEIGSQVKESLWVCCAACWCWWFGCQISWARCLGMLFRFLNSGKLWIQI